VDLERRPEVSIPLWTPSSERAESTQLHRFARAHGASDYAQLHRWSIERPDDFWLAVWEETHVLGDRGPAALELGSGLADSRFFPEGRLSIVENLLAHRGPGAALIARDELGERVELSWEQLRAEAAAAAAALAHVGVGERDLVAAILPNGVEVVVLMLGAAALGATVCTASPDFGVEGLLDRFGQLAPSVLVTTAGYSYGGRWFDVRERADEVAARLPSLRTTVAGGTFARWLEPHRGAELPIVRRPFDLPWYVLFSSGTTGRPKCIVHRAGGVLLKHRAEHVLQCDVRPGDRVLFFTTTGWMMWNWLVSVLASGATAVLYDGSPLHPGPSALWAAAEAEEVTLLGVSAKYLDALRATGLEPGARFDLHALRTLCSTGSPLSPEAFEWVYEHVAADLHLASISGGTDLCGCLVAGDPTSPVFAGEIQRPVLGLDVDVEDDVGGSLRHQPGTAGELVCRNPFPSMPLGFWGDDDRSRYQAAYFERVPGAWAQGDFATWTANDGVIITGRSDATLNPGGVRIGTAEIYRQVERLDEVQEALAFAQALPDGGERIVLLVRLAPGHQMDAALREFIRAQIRDGCSPRHVPAVVASVVDLPRTRSNKLVEVAVADVVNGRPVRNTEAIANPEALHAIAALPELVLEDVR